MAAFEGLPMHVVIHLKEGSATCLSHLLWTTWNLVGEMARKCFVGKGKEGSMSRTTLAATMAGCWNGCQGNSWLPELDVY